MQSSPPNLQQQQFIIAEPKAPASGDLKAKQEEDLLFNQKKRDEALKTNLHHVFVCLIWIAFAAFICVFMIRVIHFVLPANFAWLSDTQIQGIDKLIFSGAIGGFIGRYLNKVNA